LKAITEAIVGNTIVEELNNITFGAIIDLTLISSKLDRNNIIYDTNIVEVIKND
jgi:DeoR family fructose operon transcriptional repressor